MRQWKGPDRPEGLSLRTVGRQEPPRGRRPASGRARLLALLLALSVLALASTVAAQAPVTFEVTIEPPRATVGDHLTLTIVARHPAETRLEGPDGPEDFAPLELIEVRSPETRQVDSKIQETRLVYVLAAFQTGEVRPPPLRVAVTGAENGATTLQPPAVTIESVLPPDAAPQLRELKEPLQASGGTPTWVWAALLMAAFAGLTVLTMALVRLPLLRTPPPFIPPQEAADEAARRELDAIAGAGLLDRGELKEYYRRIASCLRQYLSRRFEIPASAMTPPEVEERLEALGVDRWPARLAVNLLQQCQAVQFAQYEPARERAEADLSSAYEVVTLTQRREEAPQPGEEAPAPS